MKAVMLAGGLGTHDSLLDPAQFVSVIESRQGLSKSPVWKKSRGARAGSIGAGMDAQIKQLGKSTYGGYLQGLIGS